MRRTLATTAVALALTAGAAAPALASDPVYPPTTPPQIEPSVVPTSSAHAAVVQNRAAAPSALAFTGAETATLAGGATLLVVGGAFLVRAARKRGSHTA